MLPDGWMDKEEVVYKCNGKLIRHQKGGSLAICDNTDGP